MVILLVALSMAIDMSTVGTHGSVYAVDDNVVIELPGTDGTDKFEVTDSTPTSLMAVFSNGNVGIGTTSPSTKLNIKQTGDTGLDSVPLKIEATTDDTGLFLGYRGPSATYAQDTLSIIASFGSTGSYKPLSFSTSDTERMRITTSGNVGIGTTSPTGKLHVDGGVAPSLQNGADIIINGQDGATNFDSAGGDILLMPGAGNGIDGQSGRVGIWTTTPSWTLTVNGTAAKPGGGSWSNSSDRRLKKNIITIDNALEKVTKLRGVNFEWVHPDEHGVTGVRQGFIAQEVEEVFPDFISEVGAQGKDKELTGNEKAKCMTLPFAFDAYLVEAIKELKVENDSLKERILALEKRAFRKKR